MAGIRAPVYSLLLGTRAGSTRSSQLQFTFVISASGPGNRSLTVADIQRIIKHLSDKGIGVLITDHNVRETLGICQRAYIVNQGSVLAAGSADQILANPLVREVYLGQDFKL